MGDFDSDFDDWGIGGTPDFSDEFQRNNDIARDLHEWRSSGGLLNESDDPDDFDSDEPAF